MAIVPVEKTEVHRPVIRSQASDLSIAENDIRLRRNDDRFSAGCSPRFGHGKSQRFQQNL